MSNTIVFKDQEYPYGEPTFDNLKGLEVGQKFIANNRCYPGDKNIEEYFKDGTEHGFKPDIHPDMIKDYKLVGRANGCWTSNSNLGKVLKNSDSNKKGGSNKYMLIREKISDSNLEAYCGENPDDSLCKTEEPVEPVEPVNCQDNPDDPMCASAKASEEDEESEEVTQKSLIEGMPNTVLATIVGIILVLMFILFVI